MKRSRFSKTTNSASKKSSLVSSIAMLVILAIGITLIAAIFVQNLQLTVQIFFLGQKTVAIPISVVMLTAFGIGGFLAFVFNMIASWRQNMLIRRAVVAAGYAKQQVKTESNKNAKYDDNRNFEGEDQDEEYEDEEDYEDEEYKDEDPDTVPYGDRKTLKSKTTIQTGNPINSQTKVDRPPLDAKYID